MGRDRLNRSLLLGACLAACTAAQAQDLQWSGFGTISSYRGDDAEAAVRPHERVKNASQKGQGRWDGDTVLGAQLRWQFQQSLELVGQVQVRDDLVNGFRPSTEWAYLGWRPSPHWSVRLGRQPLPVFLHSETLRVGYALTPVRPMAAVYGFSGSEPVDGINASLSNQAWGGTLSLDLGTGQNRVTLPRGQVDTQAFVASALRWQKEGLSLRLGLAAYRFSLKDPALQTQLDGLSQAGSLCGNCSQVLPERARTQGVEGQLINLGLIWEHGDWTLSAEAMKRGGSSVFAAELYGWYALLSHRFGTLMPYVSVGNSRNKEAALGLQAKLGLPAGVQQSLDQLDRSLHRPWGRRIELAGLRWDWHEQAALKVQYERWTGSGDKSTPRNGEIQLKPGHPPWDGRVSLLSVSLDFVF
ncbi:hypothetical protein [Roseateles sp.]|uniref:hypothetical protein n=1 Tax=Roseateles sp. TaxID=1971397 RepID=UPI003BA5F4E7